MGSGACVQALDPVLDLGLGCEEEDRRPYALLPDLFKNLKAAHARHHNIQNEAVIVSGMYVVKRFYAIVYSVHLIAVIFQYICHSLGHSRLVFCQ